LKDGSDGADVMVFHTFAAAIGKARSPIVLCFERGTIRATVDADRSHRQAKHRQAVCYNLMGQSREILPPIFGIDFL